MPASHWAAGYIAYCAQRGIINGMGDGTFAPDSPVTGLQFAKMLLCALGYNANDEYVSDDWTIKVSKDALTLKLFDGNLGGATNTPATREECALYAFNTLEKQKVTYSALLGGYIESNQFTSGAANEENTIKADFDLHKDVTDADAFQRPTGHHWYVGKTTNIISATYGNPNDEIGDVEDLKASYTTAVKANDIYNLLGKTFIDGAKNPSNTKKDVYGDFKVYVDGVAYVPVDSDSDKHIELDNFNKGNSKNLELTGNGVQTNVYAWSSKDADDKTVNHIVITIVNTYLAKVDDVKAGTSTKDPVTKVTILQTIDEDTLGRNPSAVALTDLGLNDAKLDAKGFNTDAFEEGDYVLITAASASGKNGSYSIKSMVAPTVKETTVTRYNKSGSTITFTADGDAHTAARNTAQDADIYAANNTDEVNRDIVDGEKHTLYFDEYGYLVSVADIDVDSDYVYVAQFGSKADTSGSLSDKDNLVADIYYADGTHKIVTVNTTKDKDNADAANTTDNALWGKTAAAAKADGTLGGLLGIYELTMIKGKAVLTDPGVASTAGTNVTKGISRIDGDKADGKTVFFYVHEGQGYDKDDYSVTVYTGINSVPVSKATGYDSDADGSGDAPEAEANSAIVNSDGVIKAMLVDSNFEGESSDTVYFYTGISYGVQSVGDGTYEVTYLVYVDGKEQELTLNYKDRDTAKEQYDDADNYVNDFFTVKNNDKHDFKEVVYGDQTNPTKIDKSLFNHSVTVTGTANFDKTTINDEYSYTANSVEFVDVRDVDEDDLYTSIKSLQNDFEDSDVTSFEIAIKYADNASKQVSVIYLLDVTTP